jgi:allantoinase
MIVKNGQVALPGQERPCALDIRIAGGQIVEIGQDLAGDADTLDAHGLFVLPGGIDPHVHFDDPGYTHREDFYHGSCAAASGGITTVIDMPCTSVPPVTDRRNLEHKLAVVERKSVVDFGLYGGVSAQSWQEGGDRYMAELAGDVMGFKAYFISGMEAFARLDHYRFRQVLAAASDLGLPVLLHAEDYDYVTAATPVAMAEGDRPQDYCRSRPETAEVLAVLAATELARETGADLHVVHVATARAAEIVGQSRATCETAPHYLAFTLDDFERIGAPLKVAPSVKPASNRDRLWERLADGTIDFVASDHAPCPPEEKATGSIWTDYGGIPGSGTVLPYLFSEGYLQGRLSLCRLLEVVAENAARRYGLFDRKGSLAVGKDADLALIDPGQSWTVRGAAFYSKGKITPFEGMTFQGRVVKTLLRGRVIYDAEEGILAPPGYGEFLRRNSDDRRRTNDE